MAIAKFLEQGLIKIVTSVDAGTPETFTKVRGRAKLTNVFENLQTYAKIDPTKITVKYIFTEHNFGEDEIDAFVSNCKNYELVNCNFQISLDYKKNKLEFKLLQSISYLFFQLFKNGFRKIFIDDHIMLRFISLDSNDLNIIKTYLQNKQANKILLDSNKIDNLIIYGAGTIGKEIIKKTNFFKKLKILISLILIKIK